MHAIFVTRKYPPQTGGMETFSYELTTRFPEPKTILARGRWQIDILWLVPLLAWKTIQAVRAGKNDTVVHLGDLVLAPVARMVKRHTHVPIVATAHALELTYSRWGFLYKRFVLSALDSIDEFVAVSAYTAQLLEKQGIPKSKIQVIPHGVEVRDTPNAQNHHAARAAVCALHPISQITDCKDRLLLLTAGRLVRRKGVAWFIEHVIPLILDLHPLYIVASTGPEKKRIQALIQKKLLHNSVRLIGSVSHETLTQLYSGTDIFVMPNIQVARDVEGFGFVAIEAAAHALPVIAADTDGIPEAIHHNRNGILVQPHDAAGFATAIRQLAADANERRAFGQQAQDYTRANFQWDDVVCRYHRLFEKTIERNDVSQ